MGFGYYGRHIRIDDVLEAQWKALPNYIEEEENIIVMADVSGSMCGTSYGIFYWSCNLFC